MMKGRYKLCMEAHLTHIQATSHAGDTASCHTGLAGFGKGSGDKESSFQMLEQLEQAGANGPRGLGTPNVGRWCLLK